MESYMQNTSIIETIINNPEQYQVIIEQASYSDLKLVFETYKQQYTDEDPCQILQSFNEISLREKLLGCSKSVISTLREVKNKGML